MAARKTAERRTPIVVEPGDVRQYLFDGMTLAVGGFVNSSHPMTLVREVIRSGVKDLRLVGAAMSGLEVDMLIAAGCVREVVSSFVSGEVYSPIAPMFRWAVEEDEVRVWDCDETQYYQALRAGAMQIPFMPVRSGLGTSLPEVNPDLVQFDDPITGQATARRAGRHPRPRAPARRPLGRVRERAAPRDRLRRSRDVPGREGHRGPGRADRRLGRDPLRSHAHDVQPDRRRRALAVRLPPVRQPGPLPRGRRLPARVRRPGPRRPAARRPSPRSPSGSTSTCATPATTSSTSSASACGGWSGSSSRRR